MKKDKVRVEIKMPFVKVGTIFPVVNGAIEFCNYYYQGDNLTRLVEDGYVSWVEEESLEEKFKGILFYVKKKEQCLDFFHYKKLVTAAKDYFKSHPEEIGCVKEGNLNIMIDRVCGNYISKERVLEVFDTYEQKGHMFPHMDTISSIRKALEKEFSNG